MIEEARLIANLDVAVMIEGESGTGKELLAQSIHSASSRSSNPFVAVNCGAIPQELAASELFGYEEGSFTGSIKGAHWKI
ncbi:sigma 54-interacting transcriptional regulator [Bacillus sp. N9]